MHTLAVVGGTGKCQSGNSCGEQNTGRLRAVRSQMLPSTAVWKMGGVTWTIQLLGVCPSLFSIVLGSGMRNVSCGSLTHHLAFVLGTTWCVGMVATWSSSGKTWSQQHWNGCHLVLVPGDHMDMTYGECPPFCLCPSSYLELS